VTIRRFDNVNCDSQAARRLSLAALQHLPAAIFGYLCEEW